VLAVATPCLNSPSETFIHHHIWTISPGRTGSDTDGGAAFECLILPGVPLFWPPAATFRERPAFFLDGRIGFSSFKLDLNCRDRAVEFLKAMA
jgi:hypothetical protein